MELHGGKFRAIYYGFSTLCRRVTPAMLPWIVEELAKNAVAGVDIQVEICMNTENLQVTTVAVGDSNEAVSLLHLPLGSILRRFHSRNDPKCFALIEKRQDAEEPFVCYCFGCDYVEDIDKLFHFIEAQGSLMESRIEIPKASDNFNSYAQYEVLYIGNMRTSGLLYFGDSSEFSMIDEAVQELDQYDVSTDFKKFPSLPESESVPDKDIDGDKIAAAHAGLLI